MKILELDVEHYGRFENERLAFNGVQGLQLVYGPNEAGKSTLLQLLRELFFGIPHRSQYDWTQSGQEMAATATVRLADDTEFTFRRRKGRKDTVAGHFSTSAERIDADRLARLVGLNSPDLYEQIFAFSVEELIRGGKSLESSSVTDALYGGGLGRLSEFAALRKRLETEHDELFSPRAHKKPINRLLSDIKSCSKQLNEASLRPADFQRRVDLEESLRRDVEQAQARHTELQLEFQRLTRLTQAAPLARQLRHAQSELAELDVPADLPEDADERFAALQQQRVELDNDAVRQDKVIDRLRKEQDALVLQPDLVVARESIEALYQQVGQIREGRERMPILEQEFAAANKQLTSTLQSIDPTWTADTLERLQIPLAERTALDQLALDFDQVAEERRAGATARADTQRELEALRGELEELVIDVDVDRFAALLAEADEYLARETELANLRTTLAEVDAEISSLEAKLTPLFESAPDFSTPLPVPSMELVAEFAKRLAGCDDEIKSARHDADAAGRERDQAADHLHDDAEESGPPSLDKLRAARKHRDEGWSLIVRKFRDEDTVDAELKGWSGEAADWSEAFRQALRASDETADERFTHAEAIAQREQLSRRYLELQRAANRADKAYAAAAARRDEALSEWRAAWEPVRITPQSPAVMTEWLDAYHRYSELRSVQHRHTSRIEATESRQSDFERAMNAVLAATATSGRPLIAAARSRHEDAQRIATQRAAIESSFKKLDRRLSEVQQQLAELDRRESELGARLAVTLEMLGLPDAWTIETAAAALGELDRARSRRDTVSRIAADRDAVQNLAADYANRVASVVNHLPAEDRELLPEDAVARLHSQLVSATRAADRDEELRHQLADANEERAEIARRRATCAEEVQRWFDRAGVPSENDFEAVAARARKAAEYRRNIRELEAELAGARGGESPTAFQSALDAVDEDELKVRAANLQRDVTAAQTAYESTRDEWRDAKNELDAVGEDCRAAELAETLAAHRSQLAAAVHRWAPRVIAHRIMTEAIAAFERDHRPQLLQDVSRLFARITDGRHTEVKTQLDGEQTLLAVGADGQTRRPDQLSSGTRDQLYLAIRLAYVSHYCRTSEPLPVVLDDVLVNFDEDRALQTLSALDELAQDFQILLFTCHAATVELFTRVRPDAVPLRLGETDETAPTARATNVRLAK